MRSGIERAAFLVISALLLCPVATRAQRNPNANLPRPSDVEVRLTYENDRPASGQIRVQLLTMTGSTIGEQFTHDQGQVSFHNVSPGNYRLLASGTDIEDSEARITVESRESTHFEWVRVKLRPNAATQQSKTMGAISTAMLNIPDKARKEFDKGIAEMKKNDIADAQKHFSKATEIYPQYAAAFNNLGVIAMKSGNSVEGKALFQQAIDADGSNPGGYVNLARCLMMEKKIPEARTALTRATSLNPNDPEALTLMSHAQLMAGELDAAINTAHRVHSMEHQHFAVAHLVAASAYEQKHQTEAAIAEYKLYLKESPDGPKAPDVRVALQTLENRVK
jgi:tetratricopeptide (TPR) repeat protein